MKFDYYTKTKMYLTHQPLARDVKHRSTAVWNLLKMHIVPSLETMDKDTFRKHFSHAQSFDRAIRQVQLEHPELKHKGNLENQQLEVDKIKELGYTI